MTRQELFEAMVNKIEVNIKNVVGRISLIQMEDGSGYSFNVVISSGGNSKDVYIRCREPNYQA